jgi:hypothetical protein
MNRRLEGQKLLDYPEEIWINEEKSLYPMIRVFDGFIDTQTGFITLFGSFYFEEKEHYIVIYIYGWRSDLLKLEDIQTISDALKVEWINNNCDVYEPKEKEAFFKLLESYETKEVQE